MADSPLRLREIAALSWTAARTRNGSVEDTIGNLRQTVSVTRRWLAEVESEIVSNIKPSGGRREEYSEASSVARREGSCTCGHAQQPPPRRPRTCRLVACLKAYKDARTKKKDPKELELLRQMHADFLARVVVAETEIVRLSTASEGRSSQGSCCGHSECMNNRRSNESKVLEHWDLNDGLPVRPVSGRRRDRSEQMTETSHTHSSRSTRSSVPNSVSRSSGRSSEMASSSRRGGHVSSSSVCSNEHSTLVRERPKVIPLPPAPPGYPYFL